MITRSNRNDVQRSHVLTPMRVEVEQERQGGECEKDGFLVERIKHGVFQFLF